MNRAFSFKERIIFLDFDGVLHTLSAIKGAKPPLRPEKILEGWPDTFKHLHLLKNLLEGHHDVSVIVSSSWRIFLNDLELAELLKPITQWYAGSIGQPTFGRAKAIKDWLSLNGARDFIILDDIASNFPGEWPNLILCNPERGISDINVQKSLEAWLRKTSANQI